MLTSKREVTGREAPWSTHGERGGADAAPLQRRRRPGAPEAAPGRVRPPLGPWAGPRAPSFGPRQSILRGLLSRPGFHDSGASRAPELPGGIREGPRKRTLPSACSSEFMSGGSSGHRRGPVRISAPRSLPGSQRQLPPLTASLRPSSWHLPLTRPATLIGRFRQTL